MRKRWQIFRNMVRIWQHLDTIEKSAQLMQDYGSQISPLDDAPDEVLTGINDMANLHRILTVPNKEFSTDMGTLKTLVGGCI